MRKINKINKRKPIIDDKNLKIEVLRYFLEYLINKTSSFTNGFQGTRVPALPQKDMDAEYGVCIILSRFSVMRL